MSAASRRRFLIPEVIQSSGMDCGPAALKAVLDGHGLPTSYGRLREACQTDVDGTSIDTLEQLANQLGLSAEQVMLPIDHLLLPRADALPAIAVARLPQGDTHFIVLWRRMGPFMQVMDPAVGRRLVSLERLSSELYIHTTCISAADWRSWAGGEGFVAPLRARLQRLGIAPQPFIAQALADPLAAGLADLDAATRMLASLVEAGGVARGSQASRLLAELVAETARAPERTAVIAAEYYSALPQPPAASDPEPMVELRGAVLLRFLGRSEHPASAAASPEAAALPASLRPDRRQDEVRNPLLGLWQHAGRGLAWTLAALVLGALLLAAGGVLEAGLLRGLLDWAPRLGWLPDRLQVFFAVVTICAGLWALELALYRTTLGLGRQLELRLRAALLAKIPRLGDRYLHSRPRSDLAERGHQLYRLREVPLLLLQAGRTIGQLLFTSAALVWLDPAGAPLVTLLALFTVLVPVLLQPVLMERDLRARSHQGALMRFYLDTMLGLLPLRAHAAEPALRSEYESLAVEWGRARLRLGQIVLALVGGQGLLSLLCVAALWLGYVGRHHEPSGVLLLTYWSLSLPLSGHTLTLLLRQYPAVRSSLVRLLEPLAAMEEADAGATPVDPAANAPPSAAPAAGAAIALQCVQVRLSGQTVLRDVSLDIAAGSHIAVVGASGAGKSTLLGLLLGFYRPSSGLLTVDGEQLSGEALQRLCEATAWIDPEVQLFNRSLLDNLRYGGPADALPGQELLQEAGLTELLSRMPEGLQTTLGEGGALVSGGEGQRVRLGRALLRGAPRLVLLDEPFRGLPRPDRQLLLRRLRERCRGVTLLCVTHDVSETLDFDRVLLVESGDLVEDDAPAVLRARAGGRYAALLSAEEQAAAQVWGDAGWRRLQLVDGQLVGAQDSARRGGDHDPG